MSCHVTNLIKFISYNLWCPIFQCHEPEDGVFFAQIGPTGGEQGYASITGKFKVIWNCFFLQRLSYFVPLSEIILQKKEKPCNEMSRENPLL
jgi:hypothetical protein